MAIKEGEHEEKGHSPATNFYPIFLSLSHVSKASPCWIFERIIWRFEEEISTIQEEKIQAFKEEERASSSLCNPS